MRGSCSDPIQARAEPASPDKATGTRVDFRITRGTTSKVPLSTVERSSLTLPLGSHHSSLSQSCRSDPDATIAAADEPNKHADLTHDDLPDLELNTCQTGTKVWDKDECNKTRTGHNTRLSQIPSRLRTVTRVNYHTNFPPLTCKVGQTESLYKLPSFSIKPPNATNCNVYFSKHSRSPPADARACATRKLELNATSGTNFLGGKCKWKAASKSLTAKLFNFTKTVTTRKINRRSQQSVPGQLNRFLSPIETRPPNFFTLNRPRHGYLKKKARYNNKHYG